jgi:hypothetical protein
MAETPRPQSHTHWCPKCQQHVPCHVQDPHCPISGKSAMTCEACAQPQGSML